jgi:hypothetical protein
LGLKSNETTVAMLADDEHAVLSALVNDSPRRIIARMNVSMKQARALKDFGTVLSLIVGKRARNEPVPPAAYAKLHKLSRCVPRKLQMELAALVQEAASAEVESLRC